jgi:hypothetical protein
MDMIDHKKLNRILGQLKRNGRISSSVGLARPTVPIRVLGYTPHGLQRAQQRGIPAGKEIQTAQYYVDNAIVMLVQGSGGRNLYISADGNVVVSLSNGFVVTIYTSDWFDIEMKRIIEEVRKCIII